MCVCARMKHASTVMMFTGCDVIAAHWHKQRFSHLCELWFLKNRVAEILLTPARRDDIMCIEHHCGAGIAP